MKNVVLDESQLAAVEVEADEKQIVIAGPGSGKTEVVSALVEHLVTEEDVDPTDGILVISFSNAAVHTVDARLRARGIAPVTVQTMDSLAGEILAATDDVEVETLDFDKRIDRAVRLLREDDESTERFADIEHLIVDEVQDVVGIRADFLMAIIDSLPEDGGVSLLGDPAQGIYDFQLRSPTKGRKPLSAMTFQELLHRVSQESAFETKELAGQYRAISDDARDVAILRTAVLDEARFEELDDFESGVVFMGSVGHVLKFAPTWGGTTAFLTANNGQAMLVAQEIAEAGFPVVVRRAVQQRVLASWIARLLADAPAKTINQDELKASLAEMALDLSPAAVWRVLRSTAGGKGSEVDIPQLARRLRTQRALLPDLLDQPSGPVLVSTVHRAKGLEFDNVVIVDFPDKPWWKDDESPSESARTRFVALTRARHHIVRTDGPDDRSLRRFKARNLHTERWYRGGWQKWQTFGYEMRVGDVDRDEPGGIDPRLAQERLATRVKPGDPLQLVLDPCLSTSLYPVYDVVHDDVVIARTSVAYGEDLAARIGPREKTERPWPGLSGARVETVATVAGDPQPGAVGRHGLWLAPVITGILTIDWSRNDED
ncbi:UvrD-helicase domain-containing protein [Kocuria sp. CPCC 205263]|uniref:UvrD-helicase domain-containing protein n=1 Tax=Kocuria sp. CPCC 205263 TaxID=3073555 RepID=UPI0034D68FA8